MRKLKKLKLKGYQASLMRETNHLWQSNERKEAAIDVANLFFFFLVGLRFELSTSEQAP
jgi:hypothetical protein